MKRILAILIATLTIVACFVPMLSVSAATNVSYPVYYSSQALLPSGGRLNESPYLMPATQYKTYGKTLTLSTRRPVINGYTFQYWKGSDGRIYYSGARYTTNKSVTLRPVFSTNTYRVRFTASLRGASNLPAVAYFSGQKVYRIPTKVPTYTKYTTFDWYDGYTESGTYIGRFYPGNYITISTARYQNIVLIARFGKG